MVIGHAKAPSEMADLGPVNPEHRADKIPIPLERPDIPATVELRQSARDRVLPLDEHDIECDNTASGGESVAGERQGLDRDAVIDVMQDPFEDDEIEGPRDALHGLADRSTVHLNAREASSGPLDIAAVGFDTDVLERCRDRVEPSVERRRATPDIEHPCARALELRVEIAQAAGGDDASTEESLDGPIDPITLQNAMKTTTLHGYLPEPPPEQSDGAG